MSPTQVKEAPFWIQVVAAAAALCAIVGAFTLWQILFPPTMTPQCVYYIEKYPLESFSFASDSAREETLRCLHLQWRYQQKTWKLDPNFIARPGER